MKRLTVVVAVVATGIVALRAQQPHQEHGAPAGRLGTVHFATSCSAAVSADFSRAVALLHSFWFSAAIDAFEGVLRRDPGCAMAGWGIAMSRWGNPFGGFRSAQAIKAGLAAIDRATAAGARTPRERDYLAAVDVLFRDAGTVPQRARVLEYEQRMERLAAAYSDDREARMFYALALVQSALLTDKTYANQLKAGALLEAEFAKQPDHPGLAHYIIHSYDVPALAGRALDAARRYATIAPDAPHALHMPSHTFTRVGAWQESIDTNLASAAAARKDNAPAEELHAMDYQVYAFLQTAQDAAALKRLGEIDAIGARIDIDAPGAAAPPSAGYYAWAAMPARYALERGAWQEASALAPRATPFAFPDAVTRFARGLGAARSGQPAAATREAEQLATLQAALQKAGDADWAGRVEVQRRVVMAWITLAEGRRDDALAGLREAADLEDLTEKSAITPGPITPARELLGEMLLELNRPAEALKAFEATLAKEPNRFRGVFGAAESAARAGQPKTAGDYAAKLLEICERADRPGRSELQRARTLAQGR